MSFGGVLRVGLTTFCVAQSGSGFKNRWSTLLDAWIIDWALERLYLISQAHMAHRIVLLCVTYAACSNYSLVASTSGILEYLRIIFHIVIADSVSSGLTRRFQEVVHWQLWSIKFSEMLEGVHDSMSFVTVHIYWVHSVRPLAGGTYLMRGVHVIFMLIRRLLLLNTTPPKLSARSFLNFTQKWKT